jgi:long-chain acyl-CoA synthetase
MPGNLSADDLPLQRIYRWERERPEAVFLTQPYGGGKMRDWTWGQSVAEIRRIAEWLKTQNWEPGSRVAILSRNCAWWIMADLAIWMAGHVTVPIYPSLKAQSIRQILEHSEAKACFLGATDDREATEAGIPAGVTCVRFPTAAPNDWPTWEVLVTANRPIAGNPTRGGDELATIIYTSGTTGTPKGVMHSFNALGYDAKVLAGLIKLNEKERVLSYLPLAHIVERAGMEGTAIRLGYHVFFTEGIDTFLADLSRARPTIFLSVPRLLLKFQQGVFAKIPQRKLEHLLRIPILNRAVRKRVLHKLGLDTVINAASGAAPLPTEILLWYRKLGLNLAEGYGMTETLITHLPAPGSVRPGYVGSAIPGVEAKLSGDQELLIRSPMNMLGYYKNPEGTKACFTADGFFRTGDLARIDPDGQLKIVGRLKEQFKTSKGKYVMPTPIESQLMAHPVVDACCLMGAGMAHPFAVVLLADEARKSAARAAVEQTLLDLMNTINTQLDPHEQLSFVAVAQGPWTVSNGFITPTLKIKRNVLESRYQPCVDEWMKQNRPVVWEAPPADGASSTVQ